MCFVLDSFSIWPYFLCGLLRSVWDGFGDLFDSVSEVWLSFVIQFKWGFYGGLFCLGGFVVFYFSYYVILY